MGGDTPTLGIVLGSGLGTKFVESLGPLRSIGYSDLGLPQPSIAGHPGRLHYAPVGSERVLVLQGRVHCYEGRDLEEVVLAVRALAFAGASTFVLTCAAGAVYPELKPGQLVAISDHVNLTFRSPLTGHNVADTGPRFPDMTQAYDAKLIGKNNVHGWDFDVYIRNLQAYQEKYGCKAGILKVQNRQLGAIYYVHSQEEASEAFKRPIVATTPEIPVKFYKIDDLVQMRERLLTKSSIEQE